MPAEWDLSTVEAKLAEHDQQGFQIQPAMDKVVHQLVDLDQPRPVAIVAAYPAHFPPLSGDEDQFIAVMRGLLTLLMHSTIRDEVRLRVQLVPAGSSPLPVQGVTSTEAEPGGPWCLISISDREGAFVAEIEISNRAEHAEEGGVAGYDYEACETLVRGMGGMLWTEEPEPSATTIWLALPLVGMTRTTPDISFVREAVGTHLQGLEAMGRSIFLLTDDDALSNLLAQELTDAGYRINVYQVTSEFIAMARTEQPDLVILDLQAREPSAFELANLLKQDPLLSKIPVLFLATIPDPQGGYRMDTARFLVRSEGTGAMLTTIQTALGSGVPPAERVLVVEPEEGLREQMIFHVQSHGHPVVEARSAEEALALVERTRIGVILANARIAQARDYWLIRQVKSAASEIKIYVISDTLSAEDGQEAIMRGAAGFGDTGRLPELLKKMKGDDLDPEQG